MSVLSCTPQHTRVMAFRMCRGLQSQCPFPLSTASAGGLGCLFSKTSRRQQAPALIAETRDELDLQWWVVGRTCETEFLDSWIHLQVWVRRSNLVAKAAAQSQRLHSTLCEEAHYHCCSPIWPRDPPAAGPPGHLRCRRAGGQPCGRLPSGAS